MSTSMLFESARLRYRSICDGDLDEMMEMYQDPEIQASMMAGAIVPRPDTFKETVHGWQVNPLFVVAMDKETEKFIGNASLREGEFPGELELAMKVKKEVWGQGYGKEILMIKTRLLAESYAAIDIDHDDIHAHKEVFNTKKMTDGVWLRVGPIIGEIVESIREKRLERERQKRLSERRKMIAEEYTSLLSKVAPPTISFLPTTTTIFRFPDIAEILPQDI